MKKQTTFTALMLATSITATTAQANDIKVNGAVFFDYSTHSSTGNPNETSADVKRTYINFRKQNDDIWSTRITIDSGLDGTTRRSNNVFLKYAFLKGAFSDAFQVKLGMIPAPWVGYEDNMNQHRYIARSYVDRHRMAASADTGIGVQGQLGIFSYDIVSITGGGFGNTHRTEKTDLEARFGAKPIHGLSIDLGYRIGYLGRFVAGTTENKNTLTQLLVAYDHKGDISYRVAGNLINNKVNDEIANTSTTTKGTEIWGFVRSDKFGGFIRYETTNYDDTARVKETRNVLSLDYHASDSIVVSLVSDNIKNVNGVPNDEVSTLGMFSQFKF